MLINFLSTFFLSTCYQLFINFINFLSTVYQRFFNLFIIVFSTLSTFYHFYQLYQLYQLFINYSKLVSQYLVVHSLVEEAPGIADLL